MRRVALGGPLLVLVCVGAVAASAGRPSPWRWLAWNARTHTVRLTLAAGLGGANGGFDFDGYGRGELLVTVPLGWRVIVDCENRCARRASCAVVRGALSVRPAFPGASTPQPLAGLAPGSRATFSFVASRTGSYRIASLVPGEEQARMWDVLDVVRRARPSISARPGP